MFKFKFSSVNLIVLVSLFIALVNNRAFFAKVSERLDVYTFEGAIYVVTIYAIIFSVVALIQLAIGHRFLLKGIMVLLLFVSAVLSYFNQELGVIFDVDMIRNVVETVKDNNKQEAMELLSFPLVKHVFLFGILPAVFVLFSKITYRPFVKEILIRIAYAIGLVLLVVVLLLINYKYTVYFSRQNRDLRYYITPIYAIGSVESFFRQERKSKRQPLKILGDDAVQEKRGKAKTVGVMVVGETARGDHFSLNGYSRETNPELKKEALINYTKASACGTSTAYSVPCMFSFLGRGDYSPEKASQQTNVLDVLKLAGVKVYWIDNNSSCKGVCKRTGEINIRGNPDPESPFYANGEMFDEILIEKMNDILAKEKDGADILFVLHTLGSHGPKYYKRYPDAFSAFTPSCQQSTPQACNDAEIINAYDNTILYTDHVLAKMIQYLKKDQKDLETFMIYASDHGESLGENGVYLHGLPYFLAPEAQTWVPMFTWLSELYRNNNGLDLEKVKQKEGDDKVSHDYLSHTLLGAFGIKTNVYKQDYDLFH